MGESHNEDVLWVMHMIMHRYRAKQFEMLRDGNHDVTHMEAKVLSYVGRNPGAAPGDLSRFMERDKGLLTSDSDPLDRRIMRLTLTESGLEIRKTMQQQGQRLNKLGIRGFSEEEHQQLLSLVGRVYDNFEQE
jgi:DNA-binding MarR family transcriptional regulator